MASACFTYLGSMLRGAVGGEERALSRQAGQPARRKQGALECGANSLPQVVCNATERSYLSSSLISSLCIVLIMN